MCLLNKDAPGGNKVKILQNLKVLHFDHHHPNGNALPLRYEQLVDELTVQTWLLYHHPNFEYCTLSRWDGITDKRKYRQSDC